MGSLQKSMLQDMDHVRFCIGLSTELYAPSYGNSPDVQLRSEATALEHRSTLAHIQHPTLAQHDSNPRMSLQRFKSAQPVRVSSSFLG
jgi:hypothetical protein